MADNDSFGTAAEGANTDAYNGTNPTETDKNSDNELPSKATDDSSSGSVSSDEDNAVEVLGTKKPTKRPPPTDEDSSDEDSESDLYTSQARRRSPRKAKGTISHYVPGTGTGTARASRPSTTHESDSETEEEVDDEEPPPPLIKPNNRSSQYDFSMIEAQEKKHKINIFDDDRFGVCKLVTPSGVGWECKHCGNKFTGGFNSSKAVSHFQDSQTRNFNCNVWWIN